MTDFVLSIDDAGSGGRDMVESLNRTVQFCESRDVKSTWFTVPKAGGRPMTEAWRESLCAARDAGHDLQLHGLTHGDCFEFGPPAWPATIISPQFSTDYAEREAELRQRYTVDKLKNRMEEGLRIFDEVLDVRPNVFRAPCGAISKPMFAAMREVGLRYHTCQYISGTGYAHLPHNSGRIEQEWIPDIPHRPFRWYSDVIEAPILNEYTWRGSGRRSAEFVSLMREDLSRAVAESPVVIILMHTHGIADDYVHAFRVIDAAIEFAGTQPNGRVTTLHELAASGKLDEAAVDHGADLLEV